MSPLPRRRPRPPSPPRNAGVTIAGIILAAGSSSRLGRPKQLLPLAGRPLLAHTVANAIASSLDDVIVVLGHRADEIAAAVGDLGQRTVINPGYASGQSTSLLAGMAALPATTVAVLFLLGDQPTVTPEAINTLLDAYRAAPAPIMVPVYGGERGNPVLFDRSLFAALWQVGGDEGARAIVRANADAVRLVPVPGSSPPQDVDTDDDYTRLLAAWPSTSS
jgi:molybdenum cofactor cytidylyltransferase